MVTGAFSRYLPVNAEAHAWELYCLDAGCTLVPPGTRYPIEPRLHPAEYTSVTSGRILREFQAVYITGGEGWFQDELSERRRIRSGDMFILFPGIRHAYAPSTETGWQEYWIGFAGEHANRLYRRGILDPGKPVHHLGLNQEIIADYEQMMQMCRRQGPGFQIRLGALVLQLLAHIRASEMAANTNRGDSAVVDAARSLMQFHVDDAVDVENMAETLGVAYPHLLRIFRQYTGLTPYQYFLELRIHRSKELMSNPELSIKQVAARMHFENQYYFSRLFKKKTGLTPTQWRNGERER